MPMSIVGGHKGSYRKVNPQLRQTVTSLKIICDQLNQAPDGWWKMTHEVVPTAPAEHPSETVRDGWNPHNGEHQEEKDEFSMVNLKNRQPRNSYNSGQEDESDDDCYEEEMIDLQQHEETELAFDLDKNDDSDYEWQSS